MAIDTETKLKPCPFCGGKALGPTDAWPHMITCENCGASVKGFNYAGKGAYEAIVKWNKRTTDEKATTCGPDYCDLEADDD